MLTIAEAFGMQSYTLAESSTAEAETGSPETKRITPTIQRVKLNELEMVYLKDSTVFNSINKIVQTIMAAPHHLKCPDKKALNHFREFTLSLGSSGNSTTWEELLHSLFKFQCMFGKGWVENILNKKGNRIVDWALIDPKTMDYAKNQRLKIVLDNYGNPVGYTQTLPVDCFLYAGIAKNNAPKEVILQPNQIFIEPKRIVQVKLYSLGDQFYPVGLVEPIYLNSVRKQNVEEALANAIWRHGFPIIWAQIGDAQHEPTPQQIQTMLGKLKALTYKKEIATPYYYDLRMLEAKQTKMDQHLTYFQNQQITGLGIPKAYATGGGESTNRATLSNMSDLFQLSLKDIINKTTEQIRMQMFKPICDLEGFKVCPTLDWDMVGIDEIDRKAKRILTWISAGVLHPDENMEEFIKKVEDLD